MASNIPYSNGTIFSGIPCTTSGDGFSVTGEISCGSLIVDSEPITGGGLSAEMLADMAAENYLHAIRTAIDAYLSRINKHTIIDPVTYAFLVSQNFPGDTDGVQATFKNDILASAFVGGFFPLGTLITDGGTFPACPVGNTNANVRMTNAAVVPTVSGTEGWAYSYVSGIFIINSNAESVLYPGRLYSEF